MKSYHQIHSYLLVAFIAFVMISCTGGEGAIVNKRNASIASVKDIEQTTLTVATLSDLSISEDFSTSAIAFTIADAETTMDCSDTFLSMTSSNTALVLNASVVWAGTYPSCTAVITPVADAFGASTITFEVDDGADQASTSFVLTITNVNDTPTISAVSDSSIDEDNSTSAIAFNIADAETTMDCNSTYLSMTSSNTALVLNASVVWAGTYPSCTAVITPVADAFGASTITFEVDDGSLQATESFVLTVDSVNDASVTSDQSERMDKDATAVSLTLNYTDIDSGDQAETCTPASATNGSFGSCTCSVGVCTVPFTPTGSFTGTASFTFVVNDGDDDSNASTYTLNITDASVLTPAAETVGVYATLQFSVSNIVSGPVTYSIQSGGGTIDSSTGLFVAPGTFGATTVRSTETDGYYVETTVTTAAPTYDVTLDASAKGSNLILNSTLDVQHDGSGWESVRATEGKTWGKWYWEVTIVNGTSIIVGVTEPGASLTAYIGYSSSIGYNCSDGKQYRDYANEVYGATCSAGDVIGIALDIQGNTIEFFNNGVSQGAVDYIYSYTVFPAISLNSTSDRVTVNFGASAFSHSAPAGYSSGITTNENHYYPLRAEPIAPVVSTSETIVPEHGCPPYSFAVNSGSGSVDSSGIFTATASAGTSTVTITDCQSNTYDAAVATVDQTFAKWSTIVSDKPTNIYLTDDKLSSKSLSNANYLTHRADAGVSSGKWYWEITMVYLQSDKLVFAGVHMADGSLSIYPGRTTGYSFNCDNGSTYSADAALAGGAICSKGDIIGIALNLDDGEITFYQNGAQVGVAYTGLSGTYFPAVGFYRMADYVTANFGQKPMTYTAPAGFNSGIWP